MKKIILFAAAAMMAAVTFAQTPTVSASKVTMKYCKATYGDTTIFVNNSDFPIEFDGFEFGAFGTYVRKLNNVRGCDSVVTYILTKNTEGVLPGKFTVNAQGKQIRFSKGNLQYKASNGKTFGTEGCLSHQTADGVKPGIYQFASTQYGWVGSTTPNNGNGNQNSQEWQDIFFFGNSGYNGRNPWDFSDYTGSSNIANTNYDWGVYNAISNGGNKPNLWRLPTAAEFDYLFNRPNKGGYGTINGVKAIIFLPDEWTCPSGLTFTATISSYTTNNYTATEWNLMEQNGAVCLPIKYYYQSSLHNGDETYFWTTTMKKYGAWGTTHGFPATYSSSLGGPVRLICDD